jgi:hypothetical protein
MELVKANQQRALTAQLQTDGLRFANLAREAFRFHDRLSHPNKDGTFFTPRISWVHFSDEPETGRTRFAVLVVDPNALHHVPLAHFDARALELLKVQLRYPVFRVPAEALAQLYHLSSDRAETMVAYLVDLLPQKRVLPKQVDLSTTLLKGTLMIGTDGRQQIGGTLQDLRSIMIAGAPDSGKSTLLRSLAFQAGQQGWQVYLAEPDTSHTWQREAWLRVPGVVDVRNDEAGILAMIGAIEAEVARRSECFTQYAQAHDGIPPEDSAQYTQLTSEPMPPILFGIDEYLDFRHALFADVLETVTRKYRKYGLLTLVAAHNWQAQSISSSFASLLHTRICLHVDDPYIGQATLYRNYHYGKQAVGLDVRGRGLTMINGRMTEFQCYRLPSERFATVLRPLTAAPAETPDGIDWPLVKRMVDWSMDEQRKGDLGKFSVRGVCGAFKAEISSSDFTLLAKRLQSQGYLSQAAANDVRMVTDKLAKKVAYELR